MSTDYLTLYAEPKAPPIGSAAEDAQFLEECGLLRHGAPDVLTTDQGIAFTAEFTQVILHCSQTSHRRVTAYQPQINDQTKHLNKIIAGIPPMYIDGEHKTWNVILLYAVFAYCTPQQVTTQMKRFRLVHGRDSTTLLDAMLPNVTGENNLPVAAYLQAHKFPEDWLGEESKTNSAPTSDGITCDADKRDTGQATECLLAAEQLLRRYFGPYKIIRPLGEPAYTVILHVVSASQRRRARPDGQVIRLKRYAR